MWKNLVTYAQYFELKNPTILHSLLKPFDEALWAETLANYIIKNNLQNILDKTIVRTARLKRNKIAKWCLWQSNRGKKDSC